MKVLWKETLNYKTVLRNLKLEEKTKNKGCKIKLKRSRKTSKQTEVNTRKQITELED